jgi:hypothetical protein
MFWRGSKNLFLDPRAEPYLTRGNHFEAARTRRIKVSLCYFAVALMS